MWYSMRRTRNSGGKFYEEMDCITTRSNVVIIRLQ